jgi:hypothetical protein
MSEKSQGILKAFVDCLTLFVPEQRVFASATAWKVRSGEDKEIERLRPLAQMAAYLHRLTRAPLCQC